MIIVGCGYDKIQTPFGPMIHMHELGSIAVYVDCVSVLLMIIVLVQIDRMNLEYVIDLDQ